MALFFLVLGDRFQFAFVFSSCALSFVFGSHAVFPPSRSLGFISLFLGRAFRWHFSCQLPLLRSFNNFFPTAVACALGAAHVSFLIFLLVLWSCAVLPILRLSSPRASFAYIRLCLRIGLLGSFWVFSTLVSLLCSGFSSLGVMRVWFLVFHQSDLVCRVCVVCCSLVRG